MIIIVKIFGTYVSPRNLGVSLGKVHCSPGKLPFSLGKGKNHVPKEKEFKLLRGTI
jgi:hypothetical protein